MSRLELRSVTLTFKEVRALKSVSFDIGAGEIVALTGPSGAGKTTICRVIAGLERPRSGQIWIGGRDVTGLPTPQRKVGFMFESFALYPQLTVRENLLFALKAPGRETMSDDEMDSRIYEITELVQIDHLLDRVPSELSGGQKQRVALCRALVQRPSVFLLDEPISHLDAKLRHVLRGALRRRLKATAIPTLWVSPDAMEALSVADRVAVLHEGRIEHFGTARDVYERPATVNVARLVGDPAMNLLRGRLQTEGGTVRFVHPDLSFGLNDATRRRLEKSSVGEEVVIGLRPEEIRVANGSGANTTDFEVYTFEPLGKHEIITVSVADSWMKVRTTGNPFLRSGERIRLDLSGARAFFFDPDDGRLLASPGEKGAGGRAGGC